MEQTWWNNNLSNPEMMSQFKNWIGTYCAESKLFLRQYVSTMKYKSLIDIGCGIATEFDGYKSDNYDIEYMGVDSCKILVVFNRERGVPMIEAHSECIPVTDDSYDVAFSRHVLEHQPSFKQTLAEMIRIAKKEAVHIFFLIPGINEKIDYDSSSNLYHNIYSRSDIEAFLNEHEKVERFEWKTITDNECSLHIFVKEKNGLI